MKILAIRSLYFALIAAWLSISGTIAEPKHLYGGFSSHPDSLQVHIDYINSLDMTKIEASSQFRQAVEAVPIESGISITTEQEVALSGWLYEFLIAFSSSGSDSLVAAFYLREGVNNPDWLEKVKKQLAISNLPKDDTPFPILKAIHRTMLDHQGRSYYFENVSFFYSMFNVFEAQDEYETYEAYLKTHGMITAGALYFSRTKLREDVKQRLQAGEKEIFADFMFIVEEPKETAGFEGPVRTPSFFRLAWDRERAAWRPVETYFNSQVQHNFLFEVM